MEGTIHQNTKRMETMLSVVKAFKTLLLEVGLGEAFKTHLREEELEIEEGHLQCKVSRNSKIKIGMCNQIKSWPLMINQLLTRTKAEAVSVFMSKLPCKPMLFRPQTNSQSLMKVKEYLAPLVEENSIRMPSKSI